MYPVPVCLACGARSKGETCGRCASVRRDAIFRKLPFPRLPLLKAFVSSGLLGFFLTSVGGSLGIFLARETPRRGAVMLSFSIVFTLLLLGLGLWLAGLAVTTLAHAVAVRWEVFGGGGMVSGTVTTCFGFVIGGGVVHDRMLHRAGKSGITSGIVERAGSDGVLACCLPVIENANDLALWSVLAGLVSLDLAGIVVTERLAWSKPSFFQSVQRSAPMTTLLLERRTQSSAVPALAPAFEKRLARALDSLGYACAPKTVFDLADVLHQMRTVAVDTPMVAPTDELLPQPDVASRLVAFRDELRGPELRFEAVPFQVSQVVHRALVLARARGLAPAV